MRTNISVKECWTLTDSERDSIPHVYMEVLALPQLDWRIISKSTFWVGGTNASTFGQNRARATPESRKWWLVFETLVRASLTFGNYCLARRIDGWQPLPRLGRGAQ
jgi:hypothetical protein